MSRWLVKTEPETYSFAQLVKDQRTSWDHVRNYTARMHLMAMKVGDEALVYHSVGPKSIVQPTSILLNLADSIATRQHRQNRLIERATNDLDATGGD